MRDTDDRIKSSLQALEGYVKKVKKEVGFRANTQRNQDNYVQVFI